MEDGDDKALVLAAEHRRRVAVVDADIEALHDLFAADLVHVHSTGLVHDKAQLIQHISDKRGFLSVERGDLDIRIEGDIAVMTGPITNRMRSKAGDSEDVMRGFVTQVLRRYPDVWRFTNFQLTVVTEV